MSATWKSSIIVDLFVYSFSKLFCFCYRKSCWMIGYWSACCSCSLLLLLPWDRLSWLALYKLGEFDFIVLFLKYFNHLWRCYWQLIFCCLFHTWRSLTRNDASVRRSLWIPIRIRCFLLEACDASVWGVFCLWLSGFALCCWFGQSRINVARWSYSLMSSSLLGSCGPLTFSGRALLGLCTKSVAITQEEAWLFSNWCGLNMCCWKNEGSNASFPLRFHRTILNEWNMCLFQRSEGITCLIVRDFTKPCAAIMRCSPNV